MNLQLKKKASIDDLPDSTKMDSSISQTLDQKANSSEIDILRKSMKQM